MARLVKEESWMEIHFACLNGQWTWIFLPRLPMHLYHCDCLQIFTTRFGRYLGTDNATLNRSRATGARICVEVDFKVESVKRFPSVVSPTKCIWQEVRYEKQGFYYMKCH